MENMEFKGSKGKWVVDNLHSPKEGKYPAFEIDISTEFEANMCTVWYSNLFDKEAKANALLISKAPEMLEMLKYLIEDEQLSNESIQSEILELIKEATELEPIKNDNVIVGDALSQIVWEIDHEYTKNSYLLSGDLNGCRFVEPVLNKFWGLPLRYKKWCIERRYLALYKK
jgi:hypothetical protein